MDWKRSEYTKMNVMINIFRGIYLLIMAIDVLVVVKKIIFHKKRSKNSIYYSGWFFGVCLFSSVLLNFGLFMTDIVGHSWNSLNMESLILLFVIIILNIIVTIFLSISIKPHLEITGTSFILYKKFSRINIEFSSIDNKKSEYIFITVQSSKIFPKKNIFNQREYLIVRLRNNVEIKINCNPMLFSGNRILFFKTIVKVLKIERKILANE